MTTSHDERQRLAAMGNTLRPDWPAGSLLTLITQDLKQRSYRDIAIALAYVATDPASKTPGRLREAGPWWEAAKPAAGTAPKGNGRCHNCHGLHSPLSPCEVRNIPAHHRRKGPALARAYLAELGVVKQQAPTEPTEEGSE